jgi:hypothetical protein
LFGKHLLALSTYADMMKCIFWYQLTAWLALKGAYQQSIYVYIYGSKGLSAVYICIYLWKQSSVLVIIIGYLFGKHLSALSTSMDTIKLICWYSHQLTAWLALKGAYQQCIYVYIYGSIVVFLVITNRFLVW